MTVNKKRRTTQCRKKQKAEPCTKWKVKLGGIGRNEHQVELLDLDSESESEEDGEEKDNERGEKEVRILSSKRKI